MRAFFKTASKYPTHTVEEKLPQNSIASPSAASLQWNQLPWKKNVRKTVNILFFRLHTIYFYCRPFLCYIPYSWVTLQSLLACSSCRVWVWSAAFWPLDLQALGSLSTPTSLYHWSPGPRFVIGWYATAIPHWSDIEMRWNLIHCNK